MKPEVGAFGNGVGVEVVEGGEFALGLGFDVLLELVHLGGRRVGMLPELGRDGDVGLCRHFGEVRWALVLLSAVQIGGYGIEIIYS